MYIHTYIHLLCAFITILLSSCLCTIVGCSFDKFIRDNEPLQPVTLTATTTPYPVYPSQTIPGMYYASAMTTSQFTYPVPSYPTAGSYYAPTTLPTAAAIPYTEGIMENPTPYSVPVAVPFIPVSALTQSLTEGEITQMFGNMTFSSPPISPQVTNDNQQPVTSTNVTKDTVSE